MKTLKLNRSLWRSYGSIISFLFITVVVTTYMLSRTNIEMYSVSLSIIAVLMIIGLFAVFLPYSFSFYLFLFSSVIFPGFSLCLWFVQRVPSQYGVASGVTIVLLGLVPIIVHRYAYKKDFTTSAVYEGSLIVFLFYSFGAVIFSSIPYLAPQATIDTIFFMGIVTFLLVSVQLTNVTFRVKKLNEKLQMRDRTKMIETYENALENKSQYDEDKY